MKINQKEITNIADKYNLELIILFGSQVSGKKNPESDFDVAYKTDKKLSGKELINLNCNFIDLFNNDKIDMLDLKKVDPLLLFEIAQNSQLIYGSKIDYFQFKAVAFKKYVDAQSLFELEDTLIRKKQKSLKEFLYG